MRKYQRWIFSITIGLAILSGGVFLSRETKEPLTTVQGGVSENPQVSTLPAPMEVIESQDKDESALLERPTLPFQNELEALSLIDDKVFSSEEEKQEFSKWTTNPEFVASLGGRLKRPAFTLKEKKDQNLSLSLILKADRTLALKAVEDVIKDAQIEDSKTPMEDRKQLAGIKGELIYQWTSVHPDDSQMIVSWLPGPVSQKIWMNVKQMQDSNIALSQEEARRTAGVDRKSSGASPVDGASSDGTEP